MNDQSQSKLESLLAELSDKTDVDPADPRFWKTHYESAEEAVLQLAGQADAAGLGEDGIRVLTRMSNYFGLSGKFQQAIEVGSIAKKFAADQAGKNSEAYAATLVPLGFAIGQHESQTKARKMLMESLRIREKLHGSESLSVAESLYALGSLQRESMEAEDSFASFSRCLDIRRALLPADHLDLAAALDAFGLSHYYLDRIDGLDYVKQAYEIREKKLPEDHPWLAESLNNLAMFYEQQGVDFDKVATFRRCLAISEKWYGPMHSEIAVHSENLGMALQEEGALDEAEQLFHRVIAMNEAMHGSSAECLPLHINVLVDCLIDADKEDEALDWINQGLKLLRAQEENSESKRNLLHRFANHYSSLGLEEQAIALYNELLGLLKTDSDPELEIATLCDLAASYIESDEAGQAAVCYRRALRIAQEEFGKGSAEEKEVLDRMDE